MAETKRNEAVDILKGVGIILVVLGHAMSPVMSGHGVLVFLYKIIYTFHMPLFFFISGMLSKKLVIKAQKKSLLIKNRAIRLMIPYFVWAVIYLPMKTVMKDQVRFSYEYSPFSILLGNNPDGELWFLYVMFLLCVITVLFVTDKTVVYFTVMFCILSVIAPFVSQEIKLESISLSFSMYQLGFYFLGLLLSVKSDFYKTASKGKLALMSFVIFSAYCIALYFLGDKTVYTKSFKAIAAIASIYLLMFIVNKLKYAGFNKPLAYLGKYSMEIFIIHAPILVVLRSVLLKVISSPYIYIALASVISLLLSILCFIVIRKVKWARLLLFGSK